MIFDVLFYNGNWIIDESLKNRREKLSNIIRPSTNVQLVQNFDEPEELFKVIKEKGMEGIICKDLNMSFKINGKDGRWLKKKNIKDINAVVGGVTLSHRIVNSLLLGLFDKKGYFQCIGHVGTGKLSKRDWRDLTELIKPLIRQNSPFKILPKKIKDTLWIEPLITLKIHFMEWTKSQSLRHPSIQAIVNIPPNECTFEQQ